MSKRMAAPVSPTPLIISDTTLRDGAQMPGVHFSIDDKVAIARALEAAGADVIEAGFPAGGAGEIEAVRQVAAATTRPLVMALCRAVNADVDAAWEALGDAPAERRGVGIFLATSPLHRRHKLGKTKAQCLAMIASAVAYARQRFARVTFGCEDGSRTEPAFLREAYTAAMDAGATGIGFPDTLGVLTGPRNKFRSGLDYGAGTMTVRFEGFVPWARGWPRLVGHLGISAAHLWNDPDSGATITINLGWTRQMTRSFRVLFAVVQQLRKLAAS